MENPELIEGFIAAKKALKARLTEIDQTIAALQKERKDIKSLSKGGPRGAKVAAEKKPRAPRKRGPKPAPTTAATA